MSYTIMEDNIYRGYSQFTIQYCNQPKEVGMFETLEELTEEFISLTARLQDAVEDEDVGEAAHAAIQLKKKLNEITTEISELNIPSDLEEEEGEN